ncbi:MAG TPA: hypothetical protein VEU08_05350 [Vicinamibacterales bacterium]|nr:hypothetical protein [Vicinamibacterales bacterium]
MKRAVILVIAVLAGACTSNSSPSTSPTPSTTTDTLSGTVQVKGADFKNFTVSKTGEVDVTLTAAGPPSTIAMGLFIGQVGSGVCSPLAGSTTQAVAGATAQLNGVLSPATYCVEVFDIGNQTAPVNYTVTVAHP